MLLKDLLLPIFTLPQAVDREVQRLQLDSRRVVPGDLFFALPGVHSDGCQFIDEAVKRGAIAVLVEAKNPVAKLTWQGDIPIISVPRLLYSMGSIAARFYNYPAKKLRMLGVTGTNGKTSCTHFMAQALGKPCGVIGTLGSGIYGALGEVGLTTPDAITLQALLNDFVHQGVDTVAMEVSSHSIDQGRINSIEFELGIFTNLTQDHLDYHGNLQAYAAVKRRFLADMPTQHVILNADDTYGRSWIKELARHKSVFAYTMHDLEGLDLGQVPIIAARHVELSLRGIRAEVQTPWGNGQLNVPLVGQFNLSNVLAVLTTLCFYGIPLKEVLERLAELTPVPGRMQSLGGEGQPRVVVDYAHTPDALEKALLALRPHTTGKLICVFGCGGDRDASKRPLMAKIAEKWADKVIVTNDNPRHEKPEEIAAQIMGGFRAPERISVILDRSKAIENSIQCAIIGDCVLIAGKGAECYQQVGEERMPFNDVETVLAYLESSEISGSS